jgi:murein L,D-transpeptidase YafK
MRQSFSILQPSTPKERLILFLLFCFFFFIPSTTVVKASKGENREIETGEEKKRMGSPTVPVTGLKNYKKKIRAGQNRPPYEIIIDKSDYELQVYDAEGWYASYPVVFGKGALGNKQMEGDRKTPEGKYKIIAKRVHEKWSRFLLLDYPTEQNKAAFNKLKAAGKIPANASIGGGIGIHGTWPREDYAVDRYQNWTDGCISLKRAHVEEIYAFLPIGTPVLIRL